MEQIWLFLKTWEDPILGSSIGQYSTVFVIIFATLIIRYTFCSVVYHRLSKWIGDRREDVDTERLLAIKKPLGYVILLTGIFIALNILSIPDESGKTDKFIDAFFTTLIAFSVALVAVRFVDILSIYLRNRAAATESKLDDQLVPLITKSSKIFVWLVVFAVILQNLGYSVSGLLAGLGIGGLALALAAKDTLSNLFGSVTIFLDNPFQVGDWIKVGDAEGVVERVGFRSTSIRTFYKTQVNLPNNIIANATIDNFSRMQRRRISVTLGFTYETTAEKMEQALEAIREVLRNNEGVNQDFFLVSFTGFGESSLDVMMYYFTNTINWAEYLQVRERVNLEIMKSMEKLGVEFAFKSLSVYMRGDNKS